MSAMFPKTAAGVSRHARNAHSAPFSIASTSAASMVKFAAAVLERLPAAAADGRTADGSASTTRRASGAADGWWKRSVASASAGAGERKRHFLVEIVPRGRGAGGRVGHVRRAAPVALARLQFDSAAGSPRNSTAQAAWSA